MAFHIEDALDKGKEPPAVLDLSKTKIRSKEDFEKVFERVPDYKIKAEKVLQGEIQISEQPFQFTTPRAEYLSSLSSEWGFIDPVPSSMRGVRLEDLSAVDISWRMLTLARPKTKMEEEIFTRFVELDKLKRRLKQGDPEPPSKQIISNRRSRNKSAPVVPETRYQTCKECGEELCYGVFCKRFYYEEYERVPPDEKEKDEGKQNGGGGKMKAGLLDSVAMFSGPSGGKPRPKLRRTRIRHIKKKRKKKKLKEKEFPDVEKEMDKVKTQMNAMKFTGESDVDDKMDLLSVPGSTAQKQNDKGTGAKPKTTKKHTAKT